MDYLRSLFWPHETPVPTRSPPEYARILSHEIVFNWRMIEALMQRHYSHQNPYHYQMLENYFGSSKFQWIIAGAQVPESETRDVSELDAAIRETMLILRTLNTDRALGSQTEIWRYTDQTVVKQNHAVSELIPRLEMVMGMIGERYARNVDFLV